MSTLVKVLTGAAGLAVAVGFASPAAAQYYPGYGYGYGYGYNNGGVIGAIVNAVTGGGYGGYGAYGNDRVAVDQCSRAVQARLGGGYGYGYNNGGRVVGIRSVERKNSGVRVHGIASTGGGYGYNGGNLFFTCKVDYRGGITDLEFDRGGMNYGYNGYYRGY